MKSCIFACLCLASAAARPIKSSEIDPASAEQGLVPKESVAKTGERRVGRAGAPNLRGREPKERVWNGKKALRRSRTDGEICDNRSSSVGAKGRVPVDGGSPYRC